MHWIFPELLLGYILICRWVITNRRSHCVATKKKKKNERYKKTINGLCVWFGDIELVTGIVKKTKQKKKKLLYKCRIYCYMVNFFFLFKGYPIVYSICFA